ncbi:hypothetical protein [Pseudomonas aeruginosa]|uniref:hypothetical protein n=1 Tax=Pseudomonas aeruginosa TaxID=287 RepID=UPI002E2C14C0|nr:hypothetical protein [Pseudomonas aeruginosa]
MFSKLVPKPVHLRFEMTGATTLAHLRGINSKREEMFAQLRGAHSWESVSSILQEQGYSLINNEGEPFVVNFTTHQLFPLSDCGHSMLVFTERLGPYPTEHGAK